LGGFKAGTMAFVVSGGRAFDKQAFEERAKSTNRV